MATESEICDNESFEISAVSRLTGISAHTLRIWERRYGLICPDRSDSKRRRYTRDNIRHLTLVKTLIDSGDAIGAIAQLSVQQLEARLEETTNASSKETTAFPSPKLLPYQLAACATTIAPAIAEIDANFGELEVVAKASSLEELEKLLQPNSIDLVIIEQATLFKECVEKIEQFVDRLQARSCIVVYQFAQPQGLDRFDRAGTKLCAIKSPVTSHDLQRNCMVQIEKAGISERRKRHLSSGRHATVTNLDDDSPIHPPVFTLEQLTKISQITSAINCNCPQHLVTLLTNLRNFETYSSQCKSRDAADAEVHDRLHRSTAHARHELEVALLHLLEAEGIEY